MGRPAAQRRALQAPDPCPGAADIAASLVQQYDLDETFYVFDLGRVARLHQAWTACLPRVTPFYAGAPAAASPGCP